MEEQQQQVSELSQEAKEGFDMAMFKSVESRKTRRETVRKIKKYLPIVEAELKATWESVQQNYPELLEVTNEEEMVELLADENKTRRSEFYKRLYKLRYYYMVLVEYVNSGGMKDMLKGLHGSSLTEAIKDVLKKNQPEDDTTKL